MLPTPPAAATCANYARILHQAVSQPCIMQLWVRVPLVARAAADEEGEGEDMGTDGEEDGDGLEAEGMDEDGNGGGGERPLRGPPPPPSTAAASAREDPWETWNRLRTLCEFDASLGVALGGFCGMGGGWVKGLLLPSTLWFRS